MRKVVKAVKVTKGVRIKLVGTDKYIKETRSSSRGSRPTYDHDDHGVKRQAGWRRSGGGC